MTLSKRRAARERDPRPLPPRDPGLYCRTCGARHVSATRDPCDKCAAIEERHCFAEVRGRYRR